MTTPRDDIAGLCERLRKQTRHWTGIMSRHPAFLDPELSITMMEAAAQLDSLLKERDALGERVKEMTSLLAISEDLRRKVIDVAEQWQARADALQARVKELDEDAELLSDMVVKEEDCRKMWQARALRAEQERDEAYERAAQIAIDVCNTQAAGWKRDPGEDRCGEVAASNCGLFAAQAIRRLSAGPEKEG